MKKLLRIFKSLFHYLARDFLSLALVVFALAAGLSLGHLSGMKHGEKSAAHADHLPGKEGDNAKKEAPTIWTCSMHPQIQLPKPGKCPICGMTLIPLRKESGDDKPRQLIMSPASIALAEIETQPVVRRYVTHTVRMVGKVQYDETKLAYITAWFPGRLDRLYVDYTGVTVNKNDHMVYIYSPELLTAQQELLEAVRGIEGAKSAGKETQQMAQNLLRSAEEKLRLWGLNDQQVTKMKNEKQAADHMTINAPVSGIVIHKNALEGMWVKTGTRIYTIADLSQVWVFLDAYESDLTWVHYGQEIEFTTESYPDEIFRGRIAFIAPFLNAKTRTIQLRVNVPNTKGILKPDMFVRAQIRARIANEGQVIDPSLSGKWISPMHPEIVRDKPGDCPVCGMALVPAETLGFAMPSTDASPPLVVPVSAALVTGKRAVVYVQVKGAEKPTFEGREVLLGPRAGDYYLVEKGLKEGEMVVTSGNFKIDSALQIQAKPSMMSPEETGDQGPEAEAQESKTFETSAAFRKSLTPFLAEYLALQKSLGEDDLDGAKVHLMKLTELAGQADASTLDGEAMAAWETSAKALAAALEHAHHMTDLEGIRKLNIKLSAAWIEAVESFGLAAGQSLYVAHCPMANDGEGADWLQDSKKILNPYFGQEMPGCGDIEKELSGPKHSESHKH